jgi:tetratricopeptide (TPR) repeat protein
VSLDPKCEVAYFLLGLLYAEEGKSERASDEFSKAIALLADSNRPNASVPTPGSQLTKTSAGMIVQTLVTHLPPRDAYHQRALAYQKIKNFDLALADADQAVLLSTRESGHLFEALCLRVAIHKARNQRGAAIADARKALEAAANEDARKQAEALLEELGVK